VGRAVSVDMQPEAVTRARAPEFDPSQVVYVEGEIVNEGEARADGAGQARIVSYGTQSITLEVEAAAPGWLVLNDVWYPGWEASVNGRPSQVYRANGTFRAVRVPAGRSTVTMTYHSTYLGLGIGIAVVMLAGVIVAGIKQATHSKSRPVAPRVQADS
jgi:hypothetical protein